MKEGEKIDISDPKNIISDEDLERMIDRSEAGKSCTYPFFLSLKVFPKLFFFFCSIAFASSAKGTSFTVYEETRSEANDAVSNL